MVGNRGRIKNAKVEKIPATREPGAGGASRKWSHAWPQRIAGREQGRPSNGALPASVGPC